MITFKEYLVEDEDESEDPHHTVEEAVKIYLENCKQWGNVKKPLHRYSTRWSSTNKLRTGSPRERLSRSRGGTRPIQDYIFSQPGWEDFPSRDNSIFCSTSNDTAVGEPNMMIYPFDRTRIAVASVFDLNVGDIFIGIPDGQRESFKHVSMRMFVEHIVDAMQKIVDPNGRPTSKHFVQYIDDIKKAFTNNGKFDPDANGDEELAERYDYGDVRTRDFIRILVKYVPECFQPERMGFTLESPATIDLSGNGREVWFSGKYLSVPKQYWTQFVEEVKAAK